MKGDFKEAITTIPYTPTCIECDEEVYECEHCPHIFEKHHEKIYCNDTIHICKECYEKL